MLYGEFLNNCINKTFICCCGFDAEPPCILRAAEMFFSLRVDAVLLNKVDAFFSNEVGSIILESPGMFPCNNKNLHFNVNNINKREKKITFAR